MSQSHNSDVFSSSLYDSDIENISCLTPESHQLFTPIPDLSESQHTIDSLNPDFIRPLIPNRALIPDCLARVGPHKEKSYILYDAMVNKEFMDWWFRTHCGQSRNIKWDSGHLSLTWEGFHQVARISDGAAKVMCKRCGTILEHAQSVCRGKSMRHGTSTMGKHLKLSSCINTAKDRTQKPDITQYMRSKVSALFPLI